MNGLGGSPTDTRDRPYTLGHSKFRSTGHHTVKFAVFVTCLWLVFVCATPAYAYVDPGSGGMLVQLLLGGVAGAALIARLYWQRLLKRIGIRKDEPDQKS
jgi:hypothetical protein